MAAGGNDDAQGVFYIVSGTYARHKGIDGAYVRGADVNGKPSWVGGSATMWWVLPFTYGDSAGQELAGTTVPGRWVLSNKDVVGKSDPYCVVMCQVHSISMQSLAISI
mgnify:CR=1 FL=1